MASTSNFIETTQTPSALLGEWRLEWTYVADRWQHRIQRWNGNDWEDFLITDAEGDCVLQDLFLEQRENGSAEFQGMGQSAAGIHSASIVCNPATGTISFDLATRFRERSHVVPLRMAYRPVAGAASEQPIFQRLHETRVGILSVRTEAEALTRIEWEPPAEEALTNGLSGRGLTVQWGYRIQLPSRRDC